MWWAVGSCFHYHLANVLAENMDTFKSFPLRSSALCQERRRGECGGQWQPRRRDYRPGDRLCEPPSPPLLPRLNVLSRHSSQSAGAAPRSPPARSGSRLGWSSTSRRRCTPTVWRWWGALLRPSRWFSRDTSSNISSSRENKRNHQSKSTESVVDLSRFLRERWEKFRRHSMYDDESK